MSEPTALRCVDCGHVHPVNGHLHTAAECRDVLRTRLTRERDEARAALRALSAPLTCCECGAEMERAATACDACAVDVTARLAAAESEVAHVTRERDEARADVVGLRRLIEAVSTACQPASADELDAARMEVELARAWSRLWHREALRLWREGQALGELRGLAADVAARREHRVDEECCSMCRLALAVGVRVGE